MTKLDRQRAARERARAIREARQERGVATVAR
jgi:hypothetical protein